MTKEEFIQSIALPGEEWRDVVGREGTYAVSNLARIAAIRNYYEYKKNGKIFRKKMNPHICSTSIAPSTPYRRMTFVEGGKHSTELVHVIVARAFVPNPNNFPCVDHIDDNPQNNNACNLQWCDYKMNNSKTHHKEAQSRNRRGKPAHNRRKIAQLSNGHLVRVLDSMTQLENEGYAHSAIHRVCNGRLKSHKGFQWMYLSDYESQVSMSKNSKTNSD